MGSALGWVAGAALLVLLAACAQGSIESAATAKSDWPHTATSTVPPVDPNARATFDACEWIPESALVETGIDVERPIDYWDDIPSRWHMCGWHTREDLTWQDYPYTVTIMSAPETPGQMHQNFLLTKFREELVNDRTALLAERSDTPNETCLFVFAVQGGSALVSVSLSPMAAALSDEVTRAPCDMARPHARDLEPYIPAYKAQTDDR